MSTKQISEYPEEVWGWGEDSLQGHEGTFWNGEMLHILTLV